MQKDIEMRFGKQQQTYISKVLDQTPTSKVTPNKQELSDYLHIKTMEWPASSPDFNPINHFRDQHGYAVRARVAETTTLADLRHKLFEEWGSIHKQYVTRLVTSLKNNRQAVVAVYGSFTNYWGTHISNEYISKLLCLFLHISSFFIIQSIKKIVKGRIRCLTQHGFETFFRWKIAQILTSAAHLTNACSLVCSVILKWNKLAFWLYKNYLQGPSLAQRNNL